jgi:phosphoribosylaminoimidazole-succinocarboxamide synthase
MNESQQTLLYEGKAKKVYKTSDEHLLLVTYKDDATAFNGEKRGTINGKGRVNCEMSAILFGKLETAGIPTHFVKMTAPGEMLVKAVSILTCGSDCAEHSQPHTAKEAWH